MLFNSLLMKVMIFLALSCHSPRANILRIFLYVPSGPTLFFQKFSAAILKEEFKTKITLVIHTEEEHPGISLSYQRN